MREREPGFRLRKPCWARWTDKDVAPENMKRSWLDAVKMVNAMDPDLVHGYRIQVNTKRAEDIPLAQRDPLDRPLDKPSRVESAAIASDIQELLLQARKLRIDHFYFPPSLVHVEDQNHEVLEYDQNCIACVIPKLLGALAFSQPTSAEVPKRGGV